MTFILLLLIALNFIVALPQWKNSHDWGYCPCGFLAVVLVLVLYIV